MPDTKDESENYSFDKIKERFFWIAIVALSGIFIFIIYLLFRRKKQVDEQSEANLEKGDKKAIGPNTLLKVLTSSKDRSKKDEKGFRFSEVCETLEQKKERLIREDALLFSPSMISGISLTDPALMIVPSKDSKTQLAPITITNTTTTTTTTITSPTIVTILPKNKTEDDKQIPEKSAIKKVTDANENKNIKSIDNKTKAINDLNKLKEKAIVKVKSLKKESLKKESDSIVSDLSRFSIESSSSTISRAESGKSVISVPDVKPSLMKLKLKNLFESKKLFKDIKSQDIKQKIQSPLTYDDPSDTSSLISVAKERVVVVSKLLNKGVDYKAVGIFEEVNNEEQSNKPNRLLKKIKSGKLRVKTDPKIKAYIDDNDDDTIDSVLSQTTSFDSSASGIDASSMPSVQIRIPNKLTIKGVQLNSKLSKS